MVGAARRGEAVGVLHLGAGRGVDRPADRLVLGDELPQPVELPLHLVHSFPLPAVLAKIREHPQIESEIVKLPPAGAMPVWFG